MSKATHKRQHFIRAFLRFITRSEIYSTIIKAENMAVSMQTWWWRGSLELSRITIVIFITLAFSQWCMGPKGDHFTDSHANQQPKGFRIAWSKLDSGVHALGCRSNMVSVWSHKTLHSLLDLGSKRKSKEGVSVPSMLVKKDGHSQKHIYKTRTPGKVCTYWSNGCLFLAIQAVHILMPVMIGMGTIETMYAHWSYLPTSLLPGHGFYMSKRWHVHRWMCFVSCLARHHFSRWL